MVSYKNCSVPIILGITGNQQSCCQTSLFIGYFIGFHIGIFDICGRYCVGRLVVDSIVQSIGSAHQVYTSLLYYTATMFMFFAFLAVVADIIML